ncbi:hypothetical protein LAZ67_21002482 [Cordylochernes scorpioides]|uniref:Mos1 transposase HTH domain-containing protein n=1 Tax=Cordylochernes scorpioides TaxID=51811 RepID=A0ABY6LQS3_9ARAC|nr:hypothetical protein LAZ67_21002482 [Cordylochernes scorpioides]
MEQKLKQRICIEFCVKLQISATDTFEMLNKAFPNNAPKRTTVFEWHSRFKAGRISIEDDPQNPRTTLLELEKDTGISKTTIGSIVTEDLRLKKTPAKFIPRFLTNEQKLCRLATCEDMLEMTRTDPEWKDKIITGDETWVYGYDPETKRQSAEWRGQGEPRPKKSRILKSRNKVLLVAFLDNKGIVHHEYLPAGQTVIKPEKWTNGDWILHHDNTRPHTAHLVTSFLAKNGTEILPQPPYSPDIAPNDFFLFPKLKAVLKGRHFDTREDIIEKSLLALKSIPKEAYKNCFDNWEKRWRLKNKIITGYETWVYGYDPETKHQSAEWRCQGKRFEKKGQKNLTNSGWILHHDNACPHTAHLMTSFLAKNGTQILLQPPYFPDIAPNDFFLFPKLKAVLKRRHFDTRDDIIEKSPLALKSIPKEAYKNCFDNWEKRWRWCVEARGDYFEKF